MNSDGDKIFKAVAAVGDALQGLEREDQLRVLDSVGMLLGHTSRDPLPAAKQPNNETPASRNNGLKQHSLVEFLKAKKPATNPQKIASFAAYRAQHEGIHNFSRADLEGYFAKARLAAPGNYDRDFNNAVSEGWIHEDDENSYLTQTGEEAVEAGFDGKGKARGKAIKGHK